MENTLLKVTVKNAEKTYEFVNREEISAGNTQHCDIVIPSSEGELLVKLIYVEKYQNYVLINSSGQKDILCNGKSFTKALVPQNFTISYNDTEIIFSINKNDEGKTDNSVKSTFAKIFDNETEKNRVAIVKEIGYKIQTLKNNIRTMMTISYMLNAAIVIMSVVCAFGITNFLLGLKVETTSSVLNLTTNVAFLVCISFVTGAIGLVLRWGVYSLLEFEKTSRFGDSCIIQTCIVFISSIFMLMVYIMNLFYYKNIPGFSGAALFIALLFVGALAGVCVGGGFVQFNLNNSNLELTNSEFRPDFESVLKSYRDLIEYYVNNLSPNKIQNIKSKLINNQMKMVFETIIGLLTTPFLAYGVSNTLAMCFPEAANWVRISGLRFSPIFLTLSTFLIIFAFFVLVSAFSISKQIRSSEIIKFDGFHDYGSHGVTILGVDSIKSLNKEKTILLSIAFSIIAIEFTMNVSYFITELGTDIQGMFLSLITALVPTALLIAETNLLSATVHRINNYNELIAMLD